MLVKTNLIMALSDDYNKGYHNQNISNTLYLAMQI